jgi:hypothetical protein
VAGQAKVFFLAAGGGLQQLVLIVGFMGVVALQAGPHSRRMDCALQVGGVFVFMAGQT